MDDLPSPEQIGAWLGLRQEPYRDLVYCHADELGATVPHAVRLSPEAGDRRARVPPPPRTVRGACVSGVAFVLCGLVSLAVGLWLRPERGGWLQLALGAAACVAGAQSLAQALIMAGRGRGGSLSAFGDRLRLHHAGGADDLRWESVTHLYQGDDGRPVLVISDRRIRLDSSAGAERIASAARAALDWRNCAQRRLENIPEGALSLAEDRPPECLDRGLSRIEHSTE